MELKEVAVERPEVVTDGMLGFLDELRESGKVNMLGAGPYLQEEYLLSKIEARSVLKYWMKTFSEREK